MLFVLPAIVGAFSEPLQGQIVRFMPENIGEQAATIAGFSTTSRPGQASP